MADPIIPPPPPGFTVIPPPPPGFTMETGPEWSGLTPQQAGEVDINQQATVGPTRRRIKEEGPGGLGQTIRAVGSELPFTAYGSGAGNWVQDRLPEALGGAPSGQERTWDEALGDARADMRRAGEREPVAALGGAVAGTKNLPWAKGSGIPSMLTRALQAAGLTTATEVSKGRPLAGAVTHGLGAGGVSAGIESALHIPGALRTVGEKLRGAAAERAWRTGAFTPTQAEAAAEALDPAGVSAKGIVGPFMRDARLADGTPVVQRDVTTTRQNMLKFIEEQGAAKGALVGLAEGRGAAVDSKAVMDEVRALVNELDSPEMRVAYPDVQPKLKAFVARMEAEYGPKEPALIGISQRGEGAQPIGSAPTQPNTKVTDAGLVLPTEEAPVVSYGTPGYRRTPEGDLNRAYVYKQGMEHVPPGDRLYPETTRPAPDSGWSPVFAEPPPPRTFSEWERLKTVLQSFVEDTKSGLNRSDAAIEASPALQKLRAVAAKIRQADEVAAQKVLSPEEFGAFMRAKTNYGTAMEVNKPYKMAVHGEDTASPFNVSYELRRAGRMMPYAGLLAGGGMGAATGDPVKVLAGALAGAVAGKGAQVFEHANPTMTRAYDALGRTLSKAEGPPIDVPDEVAALVAYLRSRSQ